MHMYPGGALSWDTLPIQNQPFLCPKLPLYPKYVFTSSNSQAWRCARLWHCMEGCGGDDGGGGNAMLVMAVVVMRGGIPWRVVVMSGW